MPLWHHFRKRCLFRSKGHYFGAPGAPNRSSAPWQKGTIFQNSAPGAPFSPEQCPFNKKGTKIVPLCKKAPFPNFFFWKTVPFSLKGHYFRAPMALFLCRKCMEKQCPFGKWRQNGAPKGTILRTIKRCPKGTVLVRLIILSVPIADAFF